MRVGFVLKLRTAVQEGNLSLVKRCILRDKVDPQNTEDLNRWTSLHYAVRYNHPEIVTFLLEAGHERYGVSVDIDGKSPLMIAAIHGCDDVAKILLRECPQSVAMTSHEGWTVLLYAARHGNEGVIAALLDHGADINGTDEDGSTALHHAAAWGQFKAVQLLIERGCVTAIKNHAGWSPLDYSYSLQLKSFLEESARRAFEDKRTNRRRNNTIAHTPGGAPLVRSRTRDRSPSTPMPASDSLLTRSPSLSLGAPPRVSSRNVQLDSLDLWVGADSAWKTSPPLPLPINSTGQPCVVTCLLTAWKAKTPLPYKSVGSVGEATSSFANTFSSSESVVLSPPPLPPTNVPAVKICAPGKVLAQIGEPPALAQTGAPSPPPHAFRKPAALSPTMPALGEENRDIYPAPVVVSGAPPTPTSPEVLPTLEQNARLRSTPPEIFHAF